MDRAEAGHILYEGKGTVQYNRGGRDRVKL